MSKHRNEIESLVADFTAWTNKGNTRNSAALIPQIVAKLVDFVEHATGTAKPKANTTTADVLLPPETPVVTQPVLVAPEAPVAPIAPVVPEPPVEPAEPVVVEPVEPIEPEVPETEAETVEEEKTPVSAKVTKKAK